MRNARDCTDRVRLSGAEGRQVDLRMTVSADAPTVMWLFTAMDEDRTPLSHSRELQMVTMIAELTLALADDFDIIDMLTHLCEQLSAAIGIEACGVMLSHDGRMEVAAVSGADVREVELIQLQVNDGPCLEAWRRNKPVVVDGPGEMHAEWPASAEACAKVGLVSVASIPLRGPDGPLGTSMPSGELTSGSHRTTRRRAPRSPA